MTGTLLSGALWDDSVRQLINVANDVLHRWEFGVVGVKKDYEAWQCTAFSGYTSAISLDGALSGDTCLFLLLPVTQYCRPLHDRYVQYSVLDGDRLSDRELFVPQVMVPSG